MDPYLEYPERPPCKKSDVLATLVTVFGNTRDDRGLTLMPTYTRAVLLNEIHEFIVTDELDVRPRSTVNRVGYICFAEIQKGGAIVVGDKVMLAGRVLGEVVGFDDTHLPNHLNVVIKADEMKSGFELDVAVGQQIIITDQA